MKIQRTRTGFQCCQIFDLNSPCYLHSDPNNHYYPGEFFSLLTAFMRRGAGVISREVLVSCLLCSKALQDKWRLFPLSPPSAKWAFSTTAENEFTSLKSQSDLNGIDWREPEPESLRAWRVPVPLPCSFWCDKGPPLLLLSLIGTLPSVTNTRLENAVSHLLQGLPAVCGFFPTPAREQ